MSQHPRSPRTARRRALGLVLAAALAVPLGGFGITAAAAEAPQPSAHYDMSHRGGTLLDVSGNERHASLTGFGDGSFVRAGEDEVLRFAGDGYAALPQGIVTGSDNDFTVEYTVTTRTAANHFGWVLGDGVGPWNTSELGNHVFLSPRSAQSGYGDQVLSAIRVKRDGGNGEVRLPAGGGLGAGFTTLTMVGEGDRLTVYRDGEQISTVQHPYELSSIIPSGEVLGYLGRSLYAGDPLFVGDVSDVKFWDEALSAEQLAAAQPTAAEKAAASEGILRLDLGAIVLGSNPSFDRVTRKLSLPSAVNGVALGWASSDESVVALDGRVSREIAVDTPVTLTATLAGGARLEFAVTVLAPSIEADLDAIVLAERSGEHLPLAVTGAVEGSRITWTSSDPALVTPTDPAYAPPAVGMADPFAGGGVVTRPAYGEGDREVVLTATAQLGERSVSRDYAVTIAERGRSAPDAGYASAYFRSDGDERIYAAATEGNDFFSFSEVNDGRPIVDNSADTTGHRDPYILRSHGGDTYYMIATDLCIGCGTSWGEAQSNGSLKVNVWESSDLVHWSRTNGDENGGITINRPEAGMTWAPEAYWDDELQSYVVFFASRMYDDEAHTSGPGHARMFAVLTRDFVSFTSPPETWQDTGFARIDSTVQKIGDTYYRFTKNEEGGAADGLERGKDIFMERSRVLTAPTTRSDWDADPATGWQLVDTAMTTPITGHAGEGPQIIRLNEGDPANQDGDGYVFLVDNYGDGGYRAFVTSGAALAASERGQRISQQPEWSVRERGGLPPSPRHGAFVSVTRQVLDAMHAWSEVRPAESRTEVSVEGRELTARVSALDGGEVAGTVTFAGGSWRETVTVQPAERAAPGSAEAGDADAVAGDADAAAAVAAVRVPAGVTEVSVRYDGYRDGLVAPSAAEPVSLPGGGTADAGGATADAGGGTAAAAGSGSSDGSEAGASAAGGGARPAVSSPIPAPEQIRC
ncbi:immunoglobulin-like domain-containing protein [Leucobacter massiliensis]|uniref:Atrophied bacterial Ig domain-containing protein n=1 Tax=Leucobacter massiliensis TaxID=1686285 RepID=A0A2S9QRW0_9MICO|nr:immunoglobulin-like domain-containing protein [Leucobacter massiliensis]PRI12302.1 hypothetical protein B4915_01055 [Leucobacter massiliensis]